MRALRRTAGVAAVLTYALIVLGALVRATDSGLSCPDWPTCYGHWVPLPSDIAALPDVGYTYGQIMLEWVHRLIAGVLLGPLFLAIAIMAWRARGRDPMMPRYGLALVALLLVQASLGGITVLDRNSPWSVALHLGTALTLFAVLLLVFDRARTAGPPGPRAAAPLGPLAVGVWLLALAAMASAAMTAKSGASLACATWPLCDGRVVPDLTDPLIRLHFAHRVLAAGVGLGLLALFALTRRAAPAGVRGLASLALGLVAAQILLGAMVIVLYVPVWAAVAHQALGVLTFAVISLVMWRALGAAAPAQGRRSLEIGADVGLRRA